MYQYIYRRICSDGEFERERQRKERDKRDEFVNAGDSTIKLGLGVCGAGYTWREERGSVGK